MIISSDSELQTYQQATRLSTQILDQLRSAIKVGVYPIEIDQLAGQLCQQHQVKPAFKGVTQGRLKYEYQTCISVNDEVLHGLPNQDRAFQAGDLVKIDFGIIYQGLYTDQCVTVGIEPVAAEDERLLRIGKEAVLSAVKLAKPGVRTGDLGHKMHQVAYRAGYDTLKEYVGHGIGSELHQPPEIPAYGQPHTGTPLAAGMVIAIEAQVVAGDDQVFTTDNGWTVKTGDGGKGVMFEYMVVITPKGRQILTDTTNWPLTV